MATVLKQIDVPKQVTLSYTMGGPEGKLALLLTQDEFEAVFSGTLSPAAVYSILVGGSARAQQNEVVS